MKLHGGEIAAYKNNYDRRCNLEAYRQTKRRRKISRCNSKKRRNKQSANETEKDVEKEAMLEAYRDANPEVLYNGKKFEDLTDDEKSRANDEYLKRLLMYMPVRISNTNFSIELARSFRKSDLQRIIEIR